jgi:hypothetical protein
MYHAAGAMTVAVVTDIGSPRAVADGVAASGLPLELADKLVAAA